MNPIYKLGIGLCISVFGYVPLSCSKQEKPNQSAPYETQSRDLRRLRSSADSLIRVITETDKLIAQEQIKIDSINEAMEGN